MKFLVFTALLFYIDFRIKRKVEREMKPGKNARIAAGGKLLIRRAENRGIAGGLFAGKTTGIKIASTAAAAVAALRFLTLLPAKKRVFKKIAYSFFLAGALSNLYDRWVRGRVTDYVSVVDRRVKGISRIVFNLADVFILIGGVLLFMVSAFARKK